MMGAMNPFDLPPVGAPVSVDSPDPGPERPRRGRTALVAIVTLGLVGGGVAGVSQFASADRPDLATSAQDEPTDDTIAPVDDEATDDETRGEPDQPVDESNEPVSTNDGQIVLDTGDGDPIVIDLGDLEMGRIADLTECIGLPSFDGQLGEFTPGDWSSEEFPLDLEELLGDLPFDVGALEELERDWAIELGDDAGTFDGFDIDGGSVTVIGPDGVSVVDLGENGSVTVTTDDGEVTVSTGGDASVSDLDDLLGEFGSILEGGSGMFDDEALDDILESLPSSDELPRFESIDPDAVQACIDEALGN
jgi:hypothetical protein